jgi:hypothetical protein
MALIKCKECDSQVSSKADACPKCGAKVKKGVGCGGLFLICFVVVIFMFIMAGQSPGPSAAQPSSAVATKPAPPAAPREVVENSPWDASVRQVERYLKNNLKDPDSYQSIEWSAVLKKDGGGFMVRHKYRAKNGFGGYGIENQIFTMDSAGNVIAVSP